MSLKVVVDRDRCEGNARCMQVAPEVFQVDDDDVLTVLVEVPSAAQLEAVERAVATCPRQALSLAEE